MRFRWSAVLLVLALSACGTEGPPPAPSLPADWPTQHGAAVRAVPLPSGQLLGYLPESTAGHVLCHAPQDWAGVLGGEVRTEVFLTDQCHVVSARYDLTARLTSDLVTGADTVAGRRARVDRQAAASDLDVELLPEETAKRYRGLRPTLSVTVKLRDPAATDEQGQTGQIAKDAAAAILSRAAAPGPELPEVDDKGEITAVEPGAPLPEFGVADQPMPVAAAQLCLVLGEALGVDPKRGIAEPGGRCAVQAEAGRVSATMTQAARDRAYQGRVAGRPVAREGEEQVWIKLREDSGQEVYVDGPIPASALAAIVPRLVGRG